MLPLLVRMEWDVIVRALAGFPNPMSLTGPFAEV